MRTPFDDDIIVERRFERDDGDVLLFIHKPQPYPKPDIDADPDDPPWRCFYTIRFPDGEVKRSYSVGVDGMQAMLLGIAGARNNMTYLANGTPEMRPAVRWLGEDDLGLSIPQFD